jgi:ketosteroid isomerase-like protein
MATTTIAVDTLPTRLKAFYERVSIERDAALDDLATLYAADVHFVNPVVDQRGIAAFLGVWKKALRMYRVFEFSDIVVAGTDDVFSLTYSMNIRFAIGPTFRTDMMTDCRGRDGKVVYCRDYFDPLGTLVRPIAPLEWLYRFVFRFLVA